MSVGRANAPAGERFDSVHIAGSAVVIGTAIMGERSVLAEGAVVRSADSTVVVGTASAVLENSVVVGNARISTTIGRRTVFGHRCLVIGASVGDLCEIGNASILMPGAELGDRVFLGEGTLVPAGMKVARDAVAVGRPARVIRSASADDLRRLSALRDGDLGVPPQTAITIGPDQEQLAMGQLYSYRGIVPTVAASATLFPTAEITGDVVIGPGAMIHGCRIGAGSVVEPGAIVCDGSALGAACVVRAGAVVKQRSRFGPGTDVDGFPAVAVGSVAARAELPSWAFRRDELPVPAHGDLDADPSGAA
jgi:carbonic anhydrase/acetyltransferase-like protein (isoleucine patch superfamily)